MRAGLEARASMSNLVGDFRGIPQGGNYCLLGPEGP